MDRWKSPIDLQMFEESFATKILEDQTGCVVKTCVRMGVNVDKDELVKALAYDRGQYEKGYADGIRARDSEIVRCKDCKHWVTVVDHKKAEYGLCDAMKTPIGVTPRNGYCYKGERKETEDE